MGSVPGKYWRNLSPPLALREWRREVTQERNLRNCGNHSLWMCLYSMLNRGLSHNVALNLLQRGAVNLLNSSLRLGKGELGAQG